MSIIRVENTEEGERGIGRRVKEKAMWQGEWSPSELTEKVKG